MSLRSDLMKAIATARKAAYDQNAMLNKIMDMYNEKQKADTEYLAMMLDIDIDDEEEEVADDE